jgi:hypothetical protein
MSFGQFFDLSDIQNSYIFLWPSLRPLLQAFDIAESEFPALIEKLGLDGNIGAKKSALRNGRLTLDSGLKFPFNPKTYELDDLEVKKVYEDGSNTIAEIVGFPLSDEQREALEEFKLSKQEQNIRMLAKLPYNVFYDLIIKEQSVKGPDLIKFCSVNKQLKAKCEYVRDDGRSIFTELLRQDFGLEVKANEARKTYIEQYFGKIWTFGWGEDGQLGHGDRAIQVRPKQIVEFSNVRSVSCGSYHTAMILADGTIWTFGSGEYGQLGHGDRAIQVRPQQIEGFNNVRSVSCGGSHTAMILEDSTIWTFGDGDYGKLGHGGQENQDQPKQIKGFNNVRNVSCGHSHTAMILADGTIWTFGYGRSGRLGHGGQENQERPKQIVGENGLPFSNVRSVSCGAYHTAMILADGTIWTFGYGESGLLGHGGQENQERPKKIVGFSNVRSVSCGGEHTAMILADGTIWTFGLGGVGQLGHRDRAIQDQPKQIVGENGKPFSNVRSVSCGRDCTAMITN